MRKNLSLVTQMVAALMLAALVCATGLAQDAQPETSLSGCNSGGLEPLLTPGRILLIGEIHGSQEGPALVAEAACSAASRGLPVLIALEIPLEEKDNIDTFLNSDGSDAARSTLLQGKFWQKDYQDGRSSVAMLDMIDSLRAQQLAGHQLSVVLLDRFPRFATPQLRDTFMADRLINAVEAAGTDAFVISITGNVHSRSTQGVPWNSAYLPSGLALNNKWPERTLSILLTNPPGEAWTCFDADPASCEAHKIGGPIEGTAGQVDLYPASIDGHDGAYRLKSLTASPPATK